MAKNKPVKDALAIIETIILLGDSLTPDARAHRLQLAADALRDALGEKIVLHPEIEHDPFSGTCRCDVCNLRRPMTDADVDDAQAKIKARTGKPVSKTTFAINAPINTEIN